VTYMRTHNGVVKMLGHRNTLEQHSTAIFLSRLGSERAVSVKFFFFK
jgi:hypothetical protein